MKFRTRRTSLLSLLLFTLFVWFWSALRVRYQKVIGTLPDNLIIFGDESASTQSFPNIARRSLPDVRTWTSTLCSNLQATCHSFAPSSTSSNGTVVLDNVIFNTNSPDLRAQVDAWIAHETTVRKSGTPADLSSLFAVSFGLNDIWTFSRMDQVKANAAVTASLDSLFEQLRRVAESWPMELQVLVPMAVDVTMLPAWRKQRMMIDTSGKEMKLAYALQRKWNEGLKFRAEKWKYGRVMLWDANAWMIDMVRNQRKELKDVRGSCVEAGQDTGCEHPEEFLMWDDFHFGPKTQRLMAKELAQYLMRP